MTAAVKGAVRVPPTMAPSVLANSEVVLIVPKPFVVEVNDEKSAMSANGTATMPAITWVRITVRSSTRKVRQKDPLTRAQDRPIDANTPLRSRIRAGPATHHIV